MACSHQILVTNQHRRVRVIAFEGLIGAGKSTLCHKLVAEAQALEGTTCDVACFREQTSAGMLSLFYNNPSKYGWAMQWGMLKTRLFQWELAKHVRFCKPTNTDTPPLLNNTGYNMRFWDRSVLGDYAFALWNHFQGSISREEMDVYESELGGSLSVVAADGSGKPLGEIPMLADMDLIVMLDDAPESCKWRVQRIRSNPNEDGIPLDYYAGLEDVHIMLLMQLMLESSPLNNKVLVQRWEQYDNAQACLDTYHRLLAGGSSRQDLASLTCLRTREEAKLHPSLWAVMSNPSNSLDNTVPQQGGLDKSIIYSSAASVISAVMAIDMRRRFDALESDQLKTAMSTSIISPPGCDPVVHQLKNYDNISEACTVYLPYDIMRLNIDERRTLYSSEGNLEAAHVARYMPLDKIGPLGFYRPDWKRLLMYHLSCGHHVILYTNTP